LSVFVRYCTRPHTLQRTTSRSISEILSSAFFSPTGHPHRLFRRRVGEERFTRGKAETGATGILSSALIQVKSFFLGLLILQAAKILISQRDEKQWYWPFNKPPANHAAFLIRYSLCDKEKRTWGTCQAGKMPGNYFASTRRMRICASTRWRWNAASALMRERTALTKSFGVAPHCFMISTTNAGRMRSTMRTR